MAQINKPNEYFNTVLFTGNGSTQSISGVGFQPDFVWGKNRNTTNWHDLEDVVRGVTKRLSSNETDAEATETNNFTSFDSDGFSVGSGPNVNGSGNSIVVWNWLADNTSGSSNTDGSISSTVSANTTSGFSIVTYTGTGVSETIGHGLGAVPNVIIVKGRSGTDAVDGWYTYHSSVGNTQFLELNGTGASTTFSTMWDNTTPTTTTFSTTYLSKASTNYVAYCFAEKKGFSKFGSYTGNGSTDGTFVYTGFKPSLIIQKNSGATGNWIQYDNKRDVDNVADKILIPNSSSAEATACDVDLLSNGFKFRAVNDASSNKSGNTYIYMAFAENPLVGTNNIPATAR
jgi:hypothetical protein